MVNYTSALASFISNAVSNTKSQLGDTSYYVAESGLENAIIRVMRDTTYTGETLTVGSGTATIVVTGTNPKTVVSTGTINTFSRKIQVQLTYTNGVYTISNWKEI